ncbi:hypothetical protein THRCLA_02940 [Thraustotheca clavata]|uniref:Uncharacterized protein n=1 Tax=Thraustotheca clavata TaxID=74557 RepID=A0A1W0A3T3_9STRA|nr:hypothetical protein THRCLA_02940 [Thraustotheca clavata]
MWNKEIYKKKYQRRSLRRLLHFQLNRAFRTWSLTVAYDYQKHTPLLAQVKAVIEPTIAVNQTSSDILPELPQQIVKLETEEISTQTNNNDTDRTKENELKELQQANLTLQKLYQSSQEQIAQHLKDQRNWLDQFQLIAQDKQRMLALLEESKQQLHRAKCIEEENKALRVLLAEKNIQGQKLKQLAGRCSLNQRMIQRLELENESLRFERAQEQKEYEKYLADMAMQLAEAQDTSDRLKDAEIYNHELEHMLAIQKERCQQAKLYRFEQVLDRMSKKEP